MYKEVLRDIEGIATYPIIGLILFLITFVSMLIWVFSLRREFIEEMGRLPLDSDHESAASSTEPSGALRHGE